MSKLEYKEITRLHHTCANPLEKLEGKNTSRFDLHRNKEDFSMALILFRLHECIHRNEVHVFVYDKKKDFVCVI